jgi:hypothetical protein
LLLLHTVSTSTVNCKDNLWLATLAVAATERKKKMKTTTTAERAGSTTL